MNKGAAPEAVEPAVPIPRCATAEATKAEDKRLERLLTYTVFHIGVYMSLTTALIGASVFGELDHVVLRWAVACFLIAGACGGIIAANLAEYVGEPKPFFEEKRLTFWNREFLTYRWLASIEHLMFWLGILPIALVFLYFENSLLHK